MKYLKNLLIILFCAASLLGGVMAFAYAIWGGYTPAAIAIALLLIPAIPKLWEWFKKAKESGL